MAELTFITRQEAALKIGCFDAAAIQIWKRKKHPLPKGYRAAIKVNGVWHPAKNDKVLHSELVREYQTFGEEVVEGFVYDDDSK